MRIVVLAGGFGGVTTVRHLERVLRRRTDVEITLVSRENSFVLTPLLFEACSGRLELRHCAQPIRAALQRARFIEATVESVEVERQLVRAVAPEGGAYDLPYDHLVVALGSSTNDRLIPGSSNALTFKTMADALVLRNHLIGCFERADAAADAVQRRGCLTVVVIGGGLVGVNWWVSSRRLPTMCCASIRASGATRSASGCSRPARGFCQRSTRSWRPRRRACSSDEGLTSRSRRRPGRSRPSACGSRTTPSTPAHHLTAGIVPSAVASAIPVLRDQRGRIAVDATMRSRSHPQVWALGDCAAIPGPDGRPYPALAQHAVREARHLVRNIRAAIDGRVPSPFMFRPLGTKASLGQTPAVARVCGVRLTGFVAWWVRRTYYLFQMPRWDRRLRIVLDWTVALFFRPDITRIDLRVEREQVKQARQLVERSSEKVRAMRIESTFRAANDRSMR
jgi:NADH dehydrogenase